MPAPAPNRRALLPFTITLLLALIGGFLFLFPFLSPILLAGIMALMFYPTYRRLLRYVRFPNLAALCTLILFIISYIISLLTSLLTIPLGLGHYIFLLFTLFLVLNLIPLGSGILVIPIICIAILMGSVVPGIIVMILYAIVSNIDHFIRPHVMPKEAQLSPAITMLAAFGGIAYFGILGLVYGPVIMIFIITSIDFYRKEPANFPAAVR